MQFYSPFEGGEVGVDASDPDAVATIDYIVASSEDDPTITLESINPTQLGRLSLKFLGWSHLEKYSEPFAYAVASYRPDILIEEAPGYSDHERAALNTYHNIRIRNTAAYALDPDTNEPKPILFVRHNPAYGLAYRKLAEQGVAPLIRKMDITHSQASPELFSLLEVTNTPLLELDKVIEEGYEDRSFEDLANEVRRIINTNRAIYNLRTERMITDVSTIAANALSRTDADLKVLVTHGTQHTELYRHFKARGINATREFIDDWGVLEKTTSFRVLESIDRISRFGRKPINELVEELMLSSLLAVKIARIFPEDGSVDFFRAMETGTSLLSDPDTRERLVRNWRAISESSTSVGSDIAKRNFETEFTDIVHQAMRP
jgi:hypothetical protein